MNKSYLLPLLLFVAQVATAQDQWTWISGVKAVNINRTYGTQGVAHPSNNPGGRVGMAFWRDRQGNFWIFGGKGNGGNTGNGVLNDLWKYNPSTNQWTWVAGDKNTQANGTYQSKGAPSPVNKPGARQNAVSWTDNKGNFWLFGGLGMPSIKAGGGNGGNGNGNNGGNGGNNGGNGNGGNGNNGDGDDDDDDDDGDDAVVAEEEGLLNDLWMYSPATGEWTFVSGTDKQNQSGRYGTLRQASGSNYPGGRYSASGWQDTNGNLWLFAGRGYSSRNEISLLDDVWKYSPSANNWTWMKGDKSGRATPRYGQKGNFDNSNTPGGTHGCISWTDNKGNFWLFGGGTTTDLFGDLWRYDHQNNRWAWISGTNTRNPKPQFTNRGVPDPDATPGARTLSAAWADAAGDLWLFGGNGYGGDVGSNPLNDLWKYSVAANGWAFMKGDVSINPNPVYGDKGVAAPDNNPGGTASPAFWKDQQGDFWLFGGRSRAGYLNQIWKLSRNCNEDISGTISPATASICEDGSQVLTATGGTSYEWQLNGITIAGQSSGTLTATQPGTYSVIIKNGSCSASASNTAVVTLSSSPGGTISPATASICEGGSQVLTATGGTSYEWKLNGVTITGQSTAILTATEPGIYSVIIKNGSCSGPASNRAVITAATAPAGTITPGTASICEGGSQVLTATGGTSYEWQRNGVTINGQTSATLTATEPGTYSVIIKNGGCSGPASNNSVISLSMAPAGTITPGTASICEGGSQVLTATGGTSYEWRRDGTTIEGESSAAITVTTPGTYSVIVRNGNCRGEASNTAVVTLASVAGSRYPDVNVMANVPARLSARSTGIAYAWSPGIGLDNPSSATPTVTVSADIQYLVRITPAQGCQITDTVQVRVSKENKIFVPTAFTPNGNNVNDRLRPLGNIRTIDYFKVYNRWGNLVFQTSVAGAGWDGRLNGVLQPSDTYMWVMQGTMQDGQPFKQSGKTLLIR